MKRLTIAALLTASTVGLASANAMNDQIISNLQGLGYEFIEIKNGLTQTKVEAVRGAEKLEVVYDNATGDIIKQEKESAGDDAGRSGVEIEDKDEDFVDEDGSESSDDSDESSDDDDDRDERDDDDRDDDDDDDSDDDDDDEEDDDDDEDDEDDDDDDDDS